MKPFSRTVYGLALVLLCPALAAAARPPARSAEATLPMTRLAPAKLFPDLCLLKYRITTASPECQAFFDQGLGYLYSYVYMEAARSFETALRHDPDCAMAWWGLSRALEHWGRSSQTKALQKAKELMPNASDREQMLIKARLQEKGMIEGVTPSTRRTAAQKTLDELITLYDDDEEAWFNRAQLAPGGTGRVPYYKALLRINPLHPGANHELVHFYENYRRPALGWVHAENYIKSSPGIPHPFHMQAHLATRLGRWDKTSDRSARAVELERAYHKAQNVKPGQDSQYPHHLEILTISLLHDGRYAEVRALQNEVKSFASGSFKKHWFRLALGQRHWDEALEIANGFRKRDKLTASYMAALVYLKKGEPGRAAAEVEVLRQAYQTHKTDRTLELRLWEVQGLLMCRTGAADAGVRLLAKAVAKTKDDYQHHAWGNGAYYMEAWGIGALQGGKAEAAEEAFLEALAHDPGSVRAALGMQVLCEQQGRAEEAERFAELARRCWRKADPADLEAELAALRGKESTTKDIKDAKDAKDTKGEVKP
jgi:tetratricopeptide (TPR) repeat protein